jgi:hypothetical protein
MSCLANTCTKCCRSDSDIIREYLLILRYRGQGELVPRPPASGSEFHCDPSHLDAAMGDLLLQPARHRRAVDQRAQVRLQPDEIVLPWVCRKSGAHTALRLGLQPGLLPTLSPLPAFHPPRVIAHFAVAPDPDQREGGPGRRLNVLARGGGFGSQAIACCYPHAHSTAAGGSADMTAYRQAGATQDHGQGHEARASWGTSWASVLDFHGGDLTAVLDTNDDDGHQGDLASQICGRERQGNRCNCSHKSILEVSPQTLSLRVL